MINGKKRMLHAYSSGPEQVSFDVTQKCNLRCVHCFNNSGSDAPLHDLPRGQKLEVAKQIAALRPKNVCLCGGEVTCCPYIFEIIDILRPNAGNLSMVSNGFNMTEELAQKFVDGGITLAQISIDGAYAWQHDSFRGVYGSFNRAVNAVKFLKKVGIRKMDVSLVPNRLNLHTMEAYVTMCRELGVDEIRMMPFLPSGRGKSIGRSLMPNAEEYFKFQRTCQRLLQKYKRKPDFLWGDPLDHMRRMPVNAALGLSTYIMEIKTNGDLTFSSYLPVIAGNVNRGTLKEYWDNGYKSIWANERFTRYTEQIKNIYDLETFEPSPYSGDKIVMDLLERQA